MKMSSDILIFITELFICIMLGLAVILTTYLIFKYIWTDIKEIKESKENKE